jgi:hypothetical protein
LEDHHLRCWPAQAREALGRWAHNATIFVTYLKECLAPKLKRGDVVVMDNLPSTRLPQYAKSSKQPERNYVIFSNIPRISTRSSKPSANLRRIYEKLPSEPFRASRAESQRLWPHSAAKNAPTTSDMQDTPAAVRAQKS